MKHFDVVQSFIERTETRAPSVEALGADFKTVIEELGFRNFACCSHVDPLSPPRDAVMLHNYPPGWVRYFSEAKLYAIDPVLQYAERAPLPFFWDTAFRGGSLTPPQKRLLAEAADYGLAHGYTVPLHLSWVPGSLRASCSFVPDSRCVDPYDYYMAQVLATYLYATLAKARGWIPATKIALTARERECLALAADGKTDWEISQILSLSESTVHTHFERAKERLGVATRIQAVVVALITGEISRGGLVSNGATRDKATRPLDRQIIVPAGRRLFE